MSMKWVLVTWSIKLKSFYGLKRTARIKICNASSDSFSVEGFLYVPNEEGMRFSVTKMHHITEQYSPTTFHQINSVSKRPGCRSRKKIVLALNQQEGGQRTRKENSSTSQSIENIDVLLLINGFSTPSSRIANKFSCKFNEVDIFIVSCSMYLMTIRLKVRKSSTHSNEWH